MRHAIEQFIPERKCVCSRVLCGGEATGVRGMVCAGDWASGHILDLLYNVVFLPCTYSNSANGVGRKRASRKECGEN